MAIYKGYPTKIQEVVDRFNTKVHDPAYWSSVYWSGRTPTYIKSSELADRAVSKPSGSSLTSGSSNDMVAADMISALKTYANKTTVYRRASYGRRTDGAVQGAGTAVCRLTNAYQINYGYTDWWNVSSGNSIVADHVLSFIDSLRNTADNAQNWAPIIDLKICHSSCHQSCHGSRGRR